MPQAATLRSEGISTATPSTTSAIPGRTRTRPSPAKNRSSDARTPATTSPRPSRNSAKLSIGVPERSSAACFRFAVRYMS